MDLKALEISLPDLNKFFPPLVKATIDDLNGLQKFVVQKPLVAAVYSIAMKIFGITAKALWPPMGIVVCLAFLAASICLDLFIMKNVNLFSQVALHQMRAMLSSSGLSKYPQWIRLSSIL